MLVKKLAIKRLEKVGLTKNFEIFINMKTLFLIPPTEFIKITQINLYF